MRIPLPEAWIYQFRNEKAHVSFSQLAAGNLNLSSRMGAVKSAHRRAGKVNCQPCNLDTHPIHFKDRIVYFLIVYIMYY